MKSPWIIIPTYNEKPNINRLIPALFALPVADLSVLIIDDNSPDGTAAVVRSLQQNYPQLHLQVRPWKNGLGPAYIHGFTYALAHGATELVQMDADFSHDPFDVPRLLEALHRYDVAVGSRYSDGISIINWPLRRLLLSIAGNTYARVMTGLPIKDATGGFKAWRASTLAQLDLATMNADGYGFQIVMTYRAWKKGKKIKEIPITFTERREGHSKMTRRIIFEALWLCVRLRLRG